MPIKRRSPSRKRSAPSSPTHASISRPTTSEEKRQLILAHAAHRRPLDPVQRMSLWAGMVICTVMVVGGWFYSVGSGIQNSVAHPFQNAGIDEVIDLTKQFGRTTSSTDDNSPRSLIYQLQHAESGSTSSSTMLEIPTSTTTATTSTHP